MNGSMRHGYHLDIITHTRNLKQNLLCLAYLAILRSKISGRRSNFGEALDEGGDDSRGERRTLSKKIDRKYWPSTHLSISMPTIF
jgi:hypothetical protein